MDRKIENKSKSLRLKITITAVIALCVGWWAVANTNFSGNALKIDKQRLRFSEVKYAVLEDYIPIRGQVKPSRSVYLDAIEGGRVEEILIEEGTEVKAGDIIVRLSNTNLQLDTISREAQVSEQLNNLRNTKLAIEKETLSLKSELIEINYQLIKLKRAMKQKKSLFERRLISENDYLATKDEFRYFEQRRALVVERQKTDEQVREVQLLQLENSVEQLQNNLKVARSNLENLYVKAPVSGKLTALNVELGESKARGERLGQVDNLDHFKISAMVDEFYIARLQTGQVAIAKNSGQQHMLSVSKIYSQVSNGQFKIELQFNNATPTHIRRGQTISIKLQLADGERALVIDKGGFIRDTGGNWAFIESEDGSVAIKRNIRIGRSNPDYIEVLEGLQPGERVVVSSYSGYDDKQQLIFN